MIAIAEETLDLRRCEFSSQLRLLIPTFSLPSAPTHITMRLHCTGNAPLPLIRPKAKKSAFSVLSLAPVNFRRILPVPRRGDRVVSYYALFKGWLLLSQPPTCLRQRTSFSLSIDFGTLICDLGCFPCVHEALPSHTHWHILDRGIRSLFGQPTREGTEDHSVLYPLYCYTPLPLKAFRGEPAITRLDKLITTNHNSSGDIERSIGSGLHFTFVKLHPGHG